GDCQGQNGTVGKTPTAVTVRDLRGDGHPDLVASVRGPKDDPNKVVVLLWEGGFAAPGQAYKQTTAHPSSVAIAYLNAGPYPDVVVGSGDSAEASILWGQGQGMFTPKPTRIAAGRAPIDAVPADLNGDRKLDLAF